MIISVATVVTVTIVSFVIGVILLKRIKKSQNSYDLVLAEELDSNEGHPLTEEVYLHVQGNRGYGAVETSGSFHVQGHLSPEMVHIPEGSIPM